MDVEPVVRDSFPELDRITSDAVAAGVVAAWEQAMTETGITDLEGLAWQPPEMARLGIEDESLVDHVRDVTLGAIGLADLYVDRRDQDLSLDTVVAGALVHDVSKLYEYDWETAGYTDTGELLPHPHYGVHVTAAAGLPVAVQHVVIAHSSNTAVEPATLEAEIVRRADEAAAAAIRSTGVSDLRDV